VIAAKFHEAWRGLIVAVVPCIATTVPVNEKFTFRFKKTIVLRLSVLSKNGTTTERKRNSHTIRKRNGTYKKMERNVLQTVYTRSVKNVSEAVSELA